MKKSIFLVCLVVFGVVSLSAIGPIVSVSRLGWQTDSISYGISRMVDIASLPLLDRGISVHYEGSIDKRGKNADWDWSLYQDQRGEWVIFDVDGPGCIYNLVQHRYMSQVIRSSVFILMEKKHLVLACVYLNSEKKNLL